MEGNVLAARTAALCRLISKKGGFFSVENPATSAVWNYEPVQDLLSLPGAVDVKLDQCEFGLRPPHWAELGGDVRMRKSTILRTNLGELGVLGVRCGGGHAHFRCLGNVRHEGKSVVVARFAGRYPAPLTTAWAQVVSARLAGRGPSGDKVAPTRREAGECFPGSAGGGCR